LATGGFRRILADERTATDANTSRILLSSGKVYYDLLDAREKQNRDDVAILRIEQLYPLRAELLQDALKSYPGGIPVFWVQEEPENMGARSYWLTRFGNRLFDRFPFGCIARPESASPATGSKAVHKRQEHQLLERAFGQS
jgi:2-oxoglutarate dehydrogenase E1 component